jgi:hypothetical protein
MRYEYTVTKDGEEPKLIQAMSWKKALKQILISDAKFTGKISYINKKGHKLLKFINNGKFIPDSVGEKSV